MKKILFFGTALFWTAFAYSQDSMGRSAVAQQTLVTATSSVSVDQSKKSQAVSVNTNTIVQQTSGDLKSSKKQPDLPNTEIIDPK